MRTLKTALASAALTLAACSAAAPAAHPTPVRLASASAHADQRAQWRVVFVWYNRALYGSKHKPQRFHVDVRSQFEGNLVMSEFRSRGPARMRLIQVVTSAPSTCASHGAKR